MKMLSIFNGKVMKKTYTFGQIIYSYPSDTGRISYKKEVTKTPQLLEIYIQEPILAIGDRFFDRESGKIYIIEDAMRGSGNSMIYFTDVILETIEDEESLVKAKEMQKLHTEELKEQLRKERLDSFARREKAELERVCKENAINAYKAEKLMENRGEPSKVEPVKKKGFWDWL